MGNGIAHVFARAGHKVILRDVEQKFLDRAVETIGKNLDREIKKGKLAEADKGAVLKRVQPATDMRAIAAADFVVEAVPEKVDIKRAVLTEADGALEQTPSVVATPTLTPAMERPASYSAIERAARTEMPSLSSELSGRGKSIMPMAPTPIADVHAAMASAQDPTPYVAAPLTLPEGEHSGGHLATAVQWLQTPMANTNKRNGGSPLKKVVRWLQAPVR